MPGYSTGFILRILLAGVLWIVLGVAYAIILRICSYGCYLKEVHGQPLYRVRRPLLHKT